MRNYCLRHYILSSQKKKKKKKKKKIFTSPRKVVNDLLTASDNNKVSILALLDFSATVIIDHTSTLLAFLNRFFLGFSLTRPTACAHLNSTHIRCPILSFTPRQRLTPSKYTTCSMKALPMTISYNFQGICQIGWKPHKTAFLT